MLPYSALIPLRLSISKGLLWSSPQQLCQVSILQPCFHFYFVILLKHLWAMHQRYLSIFIITEPICHDSLARCTLFAKRMNREWNHFFAKTERIRCYTLFVIHRQFLREHIRHWEHLCVCCRDHYLGTNPANSIWRKTCSRNMVNTYYSKRASVKELYNRCVSGREEREREREPAGWKGENVFNTFHVRLYLFPFSSIITLMDSN